MSWVCINIICQTSLANVFYIAVAKEPTSLNAISQSNNIIVTWDSPDMGDPVTGYMIYYQPEGGAVSSDIVSGGETETYLLDGLQKEVTYNIYPVYWWDLLL